MPRKMMNKKSAIKKAKPAMASRSVKKAPSEVHSNWLKWSLLATFLMLISVTGGWYLWEKEISKKSSEPAKQVMPIKLVEIQGDLVYVTKAQILTVLRSLSRETETESQTINFLTADLSDVEVVLESLPWVYQVNIRRIWPDKLVIDLEEQQAVAVWNNTQLINRYGAIFEPLTIEDDSLPRLSGPDDQLESLLTTFAELQTYFESAELQLHEFHLSERRSVELKLTNGIVLAVGRKDLETRINRFIDVYPALVSDNPAPIEKVDLRYDTGMAVSRMNAETRQASL